jgi:hypothetical protein
MMIFLLEVVLNVLTSVNVPQNTNAPSVWEIIDKCLLVYVCKDTLKIVMAYVNLVNSIANSVLIEPITVHLVSEGYKEQINSLCVVATLDTML